MMQQQQTQNTPLQLKVKSVLSFRDNIGKEFFQLSDGDGPLKVFTYDRKCFETKPYALLYLIRLCPAIRKDTQLQC